LTVTVGFVSLCTSELVPIREFGAYAAVGSMLSFAIVAYGLPSLSLLWPPKGSKPTELEFNGWRFLGKMLTVRSGLQSLAVIAICIGCGLGLTKMRTEPKPVQSFPNDAKITRDNVYVETNLAGGNTIETIIRFDPQSQKD